MSQIGNVYGGALYSLCKEEKLSDAALQELEVLHQAFRNEPDFLRLLTVPNITVQERCRILDDCFRERVQPYVLNFMKILTEKGLMKSFSACVAHYRELYNQDHNILPVTAVTAVPLTQSQSDRLEKKLSELTGKIAQLHNCVEPSCLGGVRLDYDGMQVDGSVASRLEAVRELLKNTVL